MITELVLKFEYFSFKYMASLARCADPTFPVEPIKDLPAKYLPLSIFANMEGYVPNWDRSNSTVPIFIPGGQDFSDAITSFYLMMPRNESIIA